MFQNEAQLARLVQFRKKLGYNKSQMAARLGLKQRAYAFYEAGGRQIPQKMLAALAGLGLNLHWLTTGQGSMMATAGWPPITDEADLLRALHPFSTPGFHEKEIVKATEMTYQILGAATLTPSKMGWLIATIAELLIRGWSEERICTEVDPMVRVLAHSGSGPQPPLSPS